MTAHLANPKRDCALDGLRGLAALAVLINHVGLATVAGVSAPHWLLWPTDGIAAVMIFFVLSGYVIGLTNPRAADRKHLGLYAWRRLVRLMRINLAGVLLAWMVVTHVDWRVLVGNIFVL